MNEQLLIFLVQKRECLYNFEHKDYGNNATKDEFWKEIAEQLKVEVDECKSKWTQLRSYFRRAKNRRKNATERAAKRMKKWRFEEQMYFLEPYIQEREQAPNIKIEDELQVSCDPEDCDSSQQSPSPQSPPAQVSQTIWQLQQRKFNEYSDNMSESTPLHETSKNVEKQQWMTFFDDVAESMLKFPPVVKLEVKREIFNLVNKKEIELLRKTM